MHGDTQLLKEVSNAEYWKDWMAKKRDTRTKALQQ